MTTIDLETKQTNKPYYVLGNTYHGDLFESTSLLECFQYLSSYELRGWYETRAEIPAKSHFEINERIYETWNTYKSTQKRILNVTARRTFPNIKK